MNAGGLPGCRRDHGRGRVVAPGRARVVVQLRRAPVGRPTGTQRHERDAAAVLAAHPERAEHRELIEPVAVEVGHGRDLLVRRGKRRVLHDAAVLDDGEAQLRAAPRPQAHEVEDGLLRRARPREGALGDAEHPRLFFVAGLLARPVGAGGVHRRAVRADSWPRPLAAPHTCRLVRPRSRWARLRSRDRVGWPARQRRGRETARRRTRRGRPRELEKRGMSAWPWEVSGRMSVASRSRARGGLNKRDRAGWPLAKVALLARQRPSPEATPSRLRGAGGRPRRRRARPSRRWGA